ncbi:MAG: hypothetical protein ACOZCL_17810 [Bacillota bacterium]
MYNDHDQMLMELRSEQSLMKGILGGIIAGAIGAALWALISVLTGYQIGYMAVGIGLLVGFAFRFLGKGIDKSFAIAAAVIAFLACMTGNVLAVVGYVSKAEGLPFFELLSYLDFIIIRDILIDTFSPIDILFYGLAIVESYKLATVKLEIPQELPKRADNQEESIADVEEEAYEEADGQEIAEEPYLTGEEEEKNKE